MEPERLARLAESARQLADIVERLVEELVDEAVVSDGDILADVYRLRAIAGRIEAQVSVAHGEDSDPTATCGLV